MAEMTVRLADAPASGPWLPPGGDAALTVGTTDTVDWPCSLSAVLTSNSGAPLTMRQPSQYKVGGSASVTGGDDFAPINIIDGGIAIYRGGNHGALVWTAATTLTSGDIGKTWESGSNRITLLKVSGGTATWSLIHDASVTTLSGSTPSGTWTLAGNPDVTFSSPTYTQERCWDDTATTANNWASGRWQRFAQITTQVIASQLEIISTTQSLGRLALPADLNPVVTLTSVWTYREDHPGTILVDVSAEIHADVVINGWGGLQHASWGANAVIGVTSGHALETWAAPGAVNVTSGGWADSEPPSAMVSRNTSSPYGGALIAILDTSGDRSSLTDAVWTSAINKLYANAYDSGLGTQSEGALLWVSGAISVCGESTDRHLHFVTDRAGDTHWWLVAESTGMTGTQHPMLMRLLGRKLTQTRGTAVVSDAITPAGVAVTTAGWAEGTVN